VIPAAAVRRLQAAALNLAVLPLHLLAAAALKAAVLPLHLLAAAAALKAAALS